MLQDESLSINQDTLSSGENRREGNFVYIRVLEKRENNKYEVSFAGNRFEVYSEKNLLPGESFRAKIIVKNGIVFLEPSFEENTLSDQNNGTLTRFYNKNGNVSLELQNNSALKAF